jgi:predicted dehydrogenase
VPILLSGKARGRDCGDIDMMIRKLDCSIRNENENAMKSTTRISRRKLLATGAAGSLGLLTAPVLKGGQKSQPSDRVNIAFIGIGNYGHRGLQELSSQNIVALCDVDWRPGSDFRNPKLAASEVIKDYPGVKRFDDWRSMLQEMDKQIDAVVISSADHAHAVAAITALKMGKHVFCEKPLAHRIGDVRAMMAAECKYKKLATQTGIQGHASEDCRMMVEWIRDGAIGTVKEVHLFQSRVVPPGVRNVAAPYSELQHVHDDIAIPPEVKWDLWVGPAPYRSYNPMYIGGRWRNWTDFGTGILGDHGPHFFDPVYWALDLGFPESIEAQTDEAYDPDSNKQTFPYMSIVRYQFPARGSRAALPVTWHGYHTPDIPKGWPADRPFPNGGGILTGTKGTLIYGPIYMSRPGPPMPGQVTLLPEELDKAYKRPEKTIARPSSHWIEWVEASKLGKQPSADFEYGGMVTQVCLLGDIAIRHKGQILRFDPHVGRFTNSESANQMFAGTYRQGWTLPT